MTLASPLLAAFGPSPVRAPAVQAASAVADLGDLPTWRLEDLYASAGSDEFRRDLAKAEADALAFENRWKGNLADAAARTGDQGIGAAVRSSRRSRT